MGEGKLRRFLSALGKYIASAVVTTVVLFSVAAVANRSAHSLADRVDRNTAETIQEVRDTQFLLCDILAEADDPDILRAVNRYCDPARPDSP